MVMNIGKAPTFGDAEPKLRCSSQSAEVVYTVKQLLATA